MAAAGAAAEAVHASAGDVAQDVRPVKAGKEKKAKAAKEKKPRAAKGSKPAAAHPPYQEMVKEAISSLKERSGSSPQAIRKYIDDKYKSVLPANYKKMLSVQLKKLSQKGKLTKVKHSYKLSDELKKPVKPKTAGSKKSAGRPKGSKNKVKVSKKEAAPAKEGDIKAPKLKVVKAAKVVKTARVGKLAKAVSKATKAVSKAVKAPKSPAKKAVVPKKAAPSKPAPKIGIPKKVTPKKPKSVKTPKASKPKAAKSK